MTTQPPRPPAAWPAAYWPLRRVLLVIAAVLFTIGSLTFAGDPLDAIPAWTWIGAAFAAWVLSGAAP